MTFFLVSFMMRFPEEYLLFKKEKNTRTHKNTRLTQPKETKRNAEMSSYYIHAGRTIEESPMREGSLYLYDKYVLLFFRPLFSFDQSQAFFFPNTKTRTFVLPSDAFFLLDTRERYTEKVGMIFSPTRHQSRKTGFMTTKRSV